MSGLNQFVYIGECASVFEYMVLNYDLDMYLSGMTLRSIGYTTDASSALRFKAFTLAEQICDQLESTTGEAFVIVFDGDDYEQD